MPLILTLGNLALVLSTAVFVLSVLRLRSRPSYLVGLYIIAYADIVLALQIAGLTNNLTRHVVFGVQLVLTAFGALLWLRLGRPSLLGPFAGYRLGKFSRDRWSVLGYASAGLLAAAVTYVYLGRIELILAVFPSNYDAMTYHLSRVGYWLQYRSFYPWPTPNPRQTTFPMNSELGMLWTVLWWGTDRLTGFVQWSAVPFSMIGIYGITRQLRYSRWQSAMTGLLWATLAQVLYQSSTPQNDLVTAGFWVACIYFFFAGLRDERPASYALSGLALGLAFGTKGTSFMVLPGLAFALLVVAWIFHKQAAFWASIARWSVACVLGVGLFGSYAYIQNMLAFGAPFGPSTARSGSALVEADGQGPTYGQRLRDNLGRDIYQLVDFSTLPFDLSAQINPTKAAVFGSLFGWLGVPVDNPDTIALPRFDLDYVNPLEENASWFGPLAILLMAAAILQSIQAIRHRDAQRLSLVALGLGFVIVQSAIESWTPYKGRYYLIPVALSFPLLAGFLGGRTFWRLAATACILLLGLATIYTVTRNTSSFKHISWRDAFSEGRKLPLWPNEFQYIMIKTNVPPEASIGLTGGLNFRDYPLFGERFTHRLTLALPDDEALLPRSSPQGFVKAFQHSDYLLLNTNNPYSLTEAGLAGFDLLGDDGLNSVWVRKGLRPPDECAGNRWPFRDFYRAAEDAVVCPQFPITPPHAGPDNGTVYIEGDRYVPVISSRPDGVLKFDLLAKRTTRLRLTMRLDPQGYTVEQTLQLRISQPNTPDQIYSTKFSGKGLVTLEIPLRTGRYTAALGLVDSPLEVSVISIQATTR